MATPQVRLLDGLSSLGRDGFIDWLHSNAPVARGGSGVWIVSGYDDVRALLQDHVQFSSSWPTQDDRQGGRVTFPLRNDDPPRHGVLRKLVAPAFTPAAMEAMRPTIEQVAVDLVAPIPADQPVDIVEKVANPLPVTTIAKLMGLPRDREGDFIRWSSAVAGLNVGPLEGERLVLLQDLREYLRNIVAQRRTDPQEDLVSVLLQGAQGVSVDVLIDLCVLLVVAGNVTTTNLIGNLLFRLATRPEDWAALATDPSLIDDAIEESVRVDTPAQMIFRRSNRDVRLHGHTINMGDVVIIYLASANRDPARWSCPADFSLAREPQRHLSFGFGVHACLGAALARMEAKAAIRALVNRFASIALSADHVEPQANPRFQGYRALSLVFGHEPPRVSARVG